MKLKILIAINDLNFGGAQKLAVDQANYLNKLGHDVTIVTFLENREKSFKHKLAAGILLIETKKIHSNLRALYYCWSILRKNKFNLLITHLFFTNTLFRFASVFIFRKPFIVSYEHNTYGNQKNQISLAIDYILSMFSDLIVAVSSEVKGFLVENNIKSDKIFVIENGVEMPEVDYKSSVLKRQTLGINDGDILIVAVGNIDYQKGHDVLLRAANIVNKNTRGCFFFVCGNDKNNKIVDKLKEEIIKYELVNNFKLLGSREDVIEIVSAADIFVMPSRWEGLSIALLEAMFLKKPILVSNIKSMDHLILNGDNGIVFTSEDSNDLAKKLISLINNKSLMIKLGESAFESVQKYSISNNVNNLLDAIGYLVPTFFSNFNLVNQKSEKWLKRTKEAVDLIKHIDSPNSKKLKIGDFGCGDKKILNLLKDIKGLNFNYTGFDILPQQEDVVKIDFSREFPDDDFDLVFCMGMIEYLDNVSYFFNKLKDKCKYVIMSCVINDKHKYKKEEVLKNGWKNYFSSSELIGLINRNDFKVMDFKMIDNGVTFLAIIKNNKFA